MEQETSFGSWLRQRRKALDLTQWDLAELVGCSGSTVQKIEDGVRRPSRQVSELLADVLRVEPQQRGTFVHWARLGYDDDPTARPNVPDQKRTPAAASPTAAAMLTHPAGQPASSLVSLPTPLTQLVGREHEVQKLLEYLSRPEVRLLTLIGPPGIGKTRLGIRLAAESIRDFEHGVYFVGLAGIIDPDLVLPAIAQTLGVQCSETQVEFAVAHWVGNKRLLLVLDNFEQVLDATPQVLDLLSACPCLRLVVTSREALRAPGEWRFPVPPLQLPLPRKEANPELSSLARVASVALFVERAKAVRPDFTLTEENAQAVAAICTRLDGLPLAIELAAAHLGLLTPPEIWSRLDSRLTLLKDGSLHIPARQRTLRGAIDWSYDLLNAREQQLFARMAVFVGGCTLPAIEAVCNPEGDLGSDVQCLVESLLNKSLLFCERVREETRLSMLETIREYALEKLEELGELSKPRHYHLEHCLVLAEAAEPRLNPAELTAWLDRLEREHDNVRAALRWALDCGNSEAALRLSGALWVFWSERGYWHEGRRWLEEAVGLTGAAESPDYARAMLGLGWIISYQGEDQASAAEWTRRSLDVYRRAGDRHGVAEALSLLAWIDAYQNRAEKAAELARESLVLYQELGDKYGITVALNIIAGFALERRDYEGARDLLTQSYKLACELNHPGRKASSLNCLGETARYEGEYEKAEIFYTQCLELCRQMGNKVGVAHSLHNLGQVSLHLGDPERASALFRESTLICLYLEDIQGLRENLAGMASVMLDVTTGGVTTGGSAFTAAMLLGAVDASTQDADPGLAMPDREQYDHATCRARSILGSGEFERAWQEGQSFSIKQAVDYVLNIQGYEYGDSEVCISAPHACDGFRMGASRTS